MKIKWNFETRWVLNVPDYECNDELDIEDLADILQFEGEEALLTEIDELARAAFEEEVMLLVKNEDEILQAVRRGVEEREEEDE